MFPKDDPEIIIYASVKNPKWNTSVGLSQMIKQIAKDIAKYKNVNTYNDKINNSTEYVVESFINKDINDVKEKLNQYNIKTITIGNGNKVIKQSADVGDSLVSGDYIILVTNDSNVTMPNIYGLSRKYITTLCDILNIKYEIEGYGYATSQSIAVGTKITGKEVLKVTLNSKLGIEVEKQEKEEENKENE